MPNRDLSSLFSIFVESSKPYDPNDEDHRVKKTVTNDYADASNDTCTGKSFWH